MVKIEGFGNLQKYVNSKMKVRLLTKVLWKESLWSGVKKNN